MKITYYTDLVSVDFGSHAIEIWNDGGFGLEADDYPNENYYLLAYDICALIALAQEYFEEYFEEDLIKWVDKCNGDPTQYDECVVGTHVNWSDVIFVFESDEKAKSASSFERFNFCPFCGKTILWIKD